MNIILEIVQLVGALLILAAYAALQRGWVKVESLWYLAANAVGGGVLAVLALSGRQWGFLVLEGTWAAVSLVCLVDQIRCKARAKRAAVGSGVRPSR